MKVALISRISPQIGSPSTGNFFLGRPHMVAKDDTSGKDGEIKGRPFTEINDEILVKNVLKEIMTVG
jgi:hypothetical protein